MLAYGQLTEKKHIKETCSGLKALESVIDFCGDYERAARSPQGFKAMLSHVFILVDDKEIIERQYNMNIALMDFMTGLKFAKQTTLAQKITYFELVKEWMSQNDLKRNILSSFKTRCKFLGYNDLYQIIHY